MNWKLFWVCGLVYILLLISNFLHFSIVSSILFWVLLILIIANFLYTVLYVFRKNKSITNKSENKKDIP